jgi:hypothetical protein
MEQNTSLLHISKTRSFLTPLASLNVSILCSLPDIHMKFNYITGMMMYVQNDYYYSNVNFLCTDILPYMTLPSWRLEYKLNAPNLLIMKLAIRTMLSDITTEIPCLIQKQLFPVSSIVGKQTILRYPINNSLNENFFIKTLINFCSVTYILMHSMWLFCLLNRFDNCDD